MKHFTIKSALVVMATLGLPFAHASEASNEDEKPTNITIEWQDAENFRDVRPSNEGRKRFRERVLKHLEEHLLAKSEDLPSEQLLEISVTDLDLAGQVWPSSFVGFGGSGSDVRLIKDVDIPRMDLSYTLKDNNGNVLKAETVKLKDMGFLQSGLLRYRNDYLRYEKKMLDDWFKQTFTKSVENS